VKRIYITWLLLITSLIFIIPASAVDLRPLSTIDAHTLPKEQVAFRLGASYSEDKWFPFEGRSTHRHEAELPSADLMIGLADNIEVDFIYSSIYRNSERFSGNWGSGDLTILGKVRIWKETSNIPTISLAVSTKLPNADYNKRFGTNEFDFFALLLLSKYVKKASIFANAGLGILGNPLTANSQDDIFVYAVGFSYPLNRYLIFMVDVSGWAVSSYGNNYSKATVGLQWQMGVFRLDFGSRVGLNEQSETWGIIGGITYILNF